MQVNIKLSIVIYGLTSLIRVRQIFFQYNFNVFFKEKMSPESKIFAEIAQFH